MQNSPFTVAQLEAIQRAYEILGEHFDHSVFVVSSEGLDEGESITATKMQYSGGYMPALGLLNWGLAKMVDEG